MTAVHEHAAFWRVRGPTGLAFLCVTLAHAWVLQAAPQWLAMPPQPTSARAPHHAMVVHLVGGLGEATPVFHHKISRPAPTRRVAAQSAAPITQPAADPVAEGVHRLPEASATAASAPDAPAQVFVPADQLAWRPMPFSAPDSTELDGTHASGLPLQARLYVASDGTVVDLVAISALLPQDAPWFERVRAMFRHTRFTPGLQDGQPVATSLDIEVSVEASVE